jgi:hypothetical protein
MLAIWEVALGGVCGACTKEGAGQWAVCCFLCGSRFSSKNTFFSARGGVTLSLRKGNYGKCAYKKKQGAPPAPPWEQCIGPEFFLIALPRFLSGFIVYLYF